MSIGCLLFLFSKPRYEVRLRIAHNNGQVLAGEHVLVIAAVAACNCLSMTVSELLADIPAKHSSVNEGGIDLHKAEVHTPALSHRTKQRLRGFSRAMTHQSLVPCCELPYMHQESPVPHSSGTYSSAASLPAPAATMSRKRQSPFPDRISLACTPAASAACCMLCTTLSTASVRTPQVTCTWVHRISTVLVVCWWQGWGAAQAHSSAAAESTSHGLWDEVGWYANNVRGEGSEGHALWSFCSSGGRKCIWSLPTWTSAL